MLYQGLAFVAVIPAFKVMRATPVSIKEMPNSSVLHKDLAKIGGKSTAKIAIHTTVIVIALKGSKLLIKIELLPVLTSVFTTY